MAQVYCVNGDISFWEHELERILREAHCSLRAVDETRFQDKESEALIKTYQILDIEHRAYITFNFYLFHSDASKSTVQLKVSVFTPQLFGNAGKAARLQTSLEQEIQKIASSLSESAK